MLYEDYSCWHYNSCWILTIYRPAFTSYRTDSVYVPLSPSLTSLSYDGFLSIFHDRIDSPQYLTRNHDQQLHLLERVLYPYCIMYMNLFEFFPVRHTRSWHLEHPISQSLTSPVTGSSFPICFHKLSLHTYISCFLLISFSIPFIVLNCSISSISSILISNVSSI